MLATIVSNDPTSPPPTPRSFRVDLGDHEEVWDDVLSITSPARFRYEPVTWKRVGFEYVPDGWVKIEGDLPTVTRSDGIEYRVNNVMELP